MLFLRYSETYWSKITVSNPPRLYLVPLLEFRRDLWHQKTRFRGLLHGVVLRDTIFSRFGKLPACDSRTDVHTTNDSRYRASIASRGKNAYNISIKTKVKNSCPQKHEKCINSLRFAVCFKKISKVRLGPSAAVATPQVNRHGCGFVRNCGATVDGNLTSAAPPTDTV